MSPLRSNGTAINKNFHHWAKMLTKYPARLRREVVPNRMERKTHMLCCSQHCTSDILMGRALATKRGLGSEDDCGPAASNS